VTVLLDDCPDVAIGHPSVGSWWLKFPPPICERAAGWVLLLHDLPHEARDFARPTTVERLDLGTEVELTHLRHQMTFSGTLSLTSEVGEVRSFFGEGRGGQQELDWSICPASWKSSTSASEPT
jgi:hypothetical protein